MSDAAAAPAADVSAGTLLRRAREAAGLHVATLAVNLKVPVRKLEALEEDRYDQLPDAVFVRALASSVCRTLKVDPQPVLERLPQTTAPRLVQARDGINAPFRGPGDGPKPGILEQVSRPVALTVVALLLAAVVLIFLPVIQDDEAPRLGPAPVATATRTEPVMPPGTPTNVTAAPAEPRPAEATASAPAAVRPASAAPAPAQPASVAAVPVAPPVAAAAPSAPAGAASDPAAQAAAGGVVVFRTRGRSWIQVTDAKGTSVFRRLMEAGETAGASGALPLTVTVGSAEATEVQVRGKPFDLGPVARDNVARFEVK
jgi:cytoskeleton protein RodZ